jgi:Lrp/AsnC family leucine-responsive transcriptional regulator
MDTFDKQALRILMRRGRSTWAELAEKLQMSAPAAAERVRKLEEQEIIHGYSAVVNAGKIGLGLTAFIAVTLDNQQARDKFLKKIHQLPEVLECHHVAGDYDFLLKVKCRGTRDLERLLTEDLKAKGHPCKTHTTIVLASHKETMELPVD